MLIQLLETGEQNLSEELPSGQRNPDRRRLDATDTGVP
jgi:hypothetical protein